MGRTVTADDNLLLRVIQGIKRVEELSLGPFLAGNELDVVNQQHIHAAIPLAELQNPVVPQRIDHFVHEALRRHVGEFQPAVMPQHVVANRVHQVCFAQTHPAIDEQRVVRARGGLGHGPARRIGKLVGGADDEGVKRVARTQAGDVLNGGCGPVAGGISFRLPLGDGCGRFRRV